MEQIRSGMSLTGLSLSMHGCQHMARQDLIAATHLHERLFRPVGDSSPLQIVRGNFHFHTVTWNDTDEVLAHFA